LLLYLPTYAQEQEREDFAFAESLRAEGLAGGDYVGINVGGAARGKRARSAGGLEGNGQVCGGGLIRIDGSYDRLEGSFNKP